MSQERIVKDLLNKAPKSMDQQQRKDCYEASKSETSRQNNLFQKIGNQVVQRLLAQRSYERSTELDDETATRINQKRGKGHSLADAIQKKISLALGHDFSGVRVHTSTGADSINRQLGAKAFTTGQDIFFREDAYDPHSSSGQELIAHELTHVVQQASGAVSGNSSGKLTVNPPDDKYEREADAVAKAVVSEINTPTLQRQELEEEDEEIQTKVVQRQELPEEEQELVQRQEFEEEEELAE
jgi:hypothetical protein